MLLHMVTFTFKQSTSEDEIIRFGAEMSQMGTQIPEVRSFRHGRDLGERTTNAHYGEVVEFDSADDFHTYLAHPEHQAFLTNYVIPLCDRWSSIQFVPI